MGENFLEISSVIGLWGAEISKGGSTILRFISVETFKLMYE